MLGGLLAKLAVFETWAAPRIVGAVALAGLWFAVPMTTPLGLAAITTAVMVAVAGWETLAGRTSEAAHA